MTIEQVLKEKRKEYQLTQEQLAEKIYVTNRTVSNWETGKTTPDIDSLIRLANLFDLSLDNLLLEGSDVVKNIKKYSEIRTIRNYSILTYVTTVSLIMVILFGSVHSWVAIISLFIAIVANLIAMDYFIIRGNHLYKSLSLSEKEADKRNNIIYSTVIFILSIIGISSFLYVVLSLFN